jgi:formate dehydrogenase major subunit
MKLPFQRREKKRPAQPYSLMSLNKAPRTDAATVTESVCPYCAVGCSLLVHTKAGRIINIEGNPRSPINEGTLCPKGANSIQLSLNPHRVKHVLYRAPYSDRWEPRSLDWALDRIAERIKQTRDESFQDVDANGRILNSVKSIGSLGGATLDNEENYLIKKLFTAGLGIIPIENQARI